MKTEKRFAYMVLGSLGLAACGGGGTAANDDDSGDGTGGMMGEGTGGASSTGGSGGEMATGGSGPSSGGSGAGTGGETADAGLDGAPADGGDEPGDGGTDPEGGPVDSDAGPLPTSGVVAFAYAGQPAAVAPYAPGAAYSYSAGDITIERTAVGTYRVDLAEVNSIRNAQVTAYGHSGYCVVSQHTNSRVNVRCYDNDGVLANARFSVAAFGSGRSRAGVTAYAFADKEGEALYGPNAHYSFNSAGGAMVATRSNVGTYRIEFNDLSMSRSNVQVSAVASSHHCSLVNWGAGIVNVACYDELGEHADTKYLVTVLERVEEESGVRVLGFARTTSSTDAVTDLTGGVYTFNGQGGSIVSERTATGAYTITFAGADFSTAHPQVTQWFGNRHCGVTQWGAAWVKVGCFDAAGAASDALFSVVVVE